MTHHGTDPLWLATAEPTAYETLDGGREVDVDVAVIGGGIAGVTTALLLKRDGASVALLERGVVGGGATGYTTAKVSALQQTKLSDIRKMHGDDGATDYAQASVAAIDRMEQLVGELGVDCDWERLPAFTYAATADEVSTVAQEAETPPAA